MSGHDRGSLFEGAIGKTRARSVRPCRSRSGRRSGLPGAHSAFFDACRAKIDADGVERRFGRTEHDRCRPADLGIDPVFPHQICPDGQRRAAAERPDKYQRRDLRRDAKQAEDRRENGREQRKKPLSRSIVTAVSISTSVGVSESISRSPSCAPVSIPP